MTSYTIIGTPFSTFTRSITLGLRFKGISYQQLATTPHSDIAYKYHCFGFLPTLVIHEPGKADVKLRESAAIVRYIDRIRPEPSLQVPAGEMDVPEKMWEFVSMAGSYGFPRVEGGCVKPRVKSIDEGKPSDAVLREQISEGVAILKDFLTHMEHLMASDGYVYGSHVTWADFFLFPLLADLRATPEGEVLSPRMVSWMKKMDELDAVKDTTEGTLSVGARP